MSNYTSRKDPADTQTLSTKDVPNCCGIPIHQGKPKLDLLQIQMKFCSYCQQEANSLRVKSKARWEPADGGLRL